MSETGEENLKAAIFKLKEIAGTDVVLKSKYMKLNRLDIWSKAIF